MIKLPNLFLKNAPEKGESTMNDQEHDTEFDSLIILLTLTINLLSFINGTEILEHHRLIQGCLVVFCDDFA